MADLIRAQSPATAVFPDLGLSGEEISMKKCVTKSRLGKPSFVKKKIFCEITS